MDQNFHFYNGPLQYNCWQMVLPSAKQEYKKASIHWQDSAPPILGYWPTTEPNAG